MKMLVSNIKANQGLRFNTEVNFPLEIVAGSMNNPDKNSTFLDIHTQLLKRL